MSGGGKNLLKSWNDALHGSDVLLLKSELLARGNLWSCLAVGREGRGRGRSRRCGAQIAVWRERQTEVHGGSGLQAGNRGWERWEDETSCSDGREGKGQLLVEGRLRTRDGLRELLALWDGLRRRSGCIAVERFVIHEERCLAAVYYNGDDDDDDDRDPGTGGSFVSQWEGRSSRRRNPLALYTCLLAPPATADDSALSRAAPLAQHALDSLESISTPPAPPAPPAHRRRRHAAAVDVRCRCHVCHPRQNPCTRFEWQRACVVSTRCTSSPSYLVSSLMHTSPV